MRLWFLECYSRNSRGCWSRNNSCLCKSCHAQSSLQSRDGTENWSDTLCGRMGRNYRLGVSCVVCARSAFVCSNSIMLICVPPLSNQQEVWVKRSYITQTLSLSVTQLLSVQGFNHMASVHVQFSLDCDFFIMYWWAIFQRERYVRKVRNWTFLSSGCNFFSQADPHGVCAQCRCFLWGTICRNSVFTENFTSIDRKFHIHWFSGSQPFWLKSPLSI